jgi:hypothetical protein
MYSLRGKSKSAYLNYIVLVQVSMPDVQFAREIRGVRTSITLS